MHCGRPIAVPVWSFLLVDSTVQPIYAAPATAKKLALQASTAETVQPNFDPR